MTRGDSLLVRPVARSPWRVVMIVVLGFLLGAMLTKLSLWFLPGRPVPRVLYHDHLRQLGSPERGSNGDRVHVGADYAGRKPIQRGRRVGRGLLGSYDALRPAAAGPQDLGTKI